MTHGHFFPKRTEPFEGASLSSGYPAPTRPGIVAGTQKNQAVCAAKCRSLVSSHKLTWNLTGARSLQKEKRSSRTLQRSGSVLVGGRISHSMQLTRVPQNESLPSEATLKPLALPGPSWLRTNHRIVQQLLSFAVMTMALGLVHQSA